MISAGYELEVEIKFSGWIKALRTRTRSSINQTKQPKYMFLNKIPNRGDRVLLEIHTPCARTGHRGNN